MAKKKGTGQWQMPQAGLDEGEEPETAWKRELREEIRASAEDVDLLGCYPEWLAYELPKEERAKSEVQAKQGRGQVQKWFFVRLKDGVKIVFEPENPENQEFFDHKWMFLDALAELTWEVRRPIYRKLALHINVLKQAGKERQ
jgi:putative (di)nucleoside polyphosphate hydrolase